MSTAMDYSKITVAALKEMLAEKGLDTTGKKSDLVERLVDAQDEEAGEEKDDVEMEEDEGEQNGTGEADEHGEGGDEEQGKEDPNQSEVYLDAEDEEALLEGEDEMADGGEAAAEPAEGTEGGEGEGEETEAGEGDGEVGEGDGEDGEGDGEEKKTSTEEEKKEEEKDDKTADEDDLPDDPEFMGRMKRRQRPYDVMKAKVDRIRDIRGRTVLVFPIVTTDLCEEWLKESLQKAQQFFVRFFEYDCSKCEEGSMELRLRSVEEAKEVAASLKEKKENLHIRHLDPSDVVDKALMEMKGIVEDPRLATSKRMLVVEDLTSNVKEDDLWELFKDATYIFIPRVCSGDTKGYAYVDFKSEEDCHGADLKYMEKPPEVKGDKLFIRPVWLGDGSHVEGMLTTIEREELRIKIRGLRTKRQEAITAEEEDKVAEIGKEIGEIQWKLNRDSYLSKLSSKKDFNKRRPQQQKRKQPPPQQRQSGNKRARQSWSSSQPPSLLDMPTRNRRGGGGGGYSGGNYSGGYQRGGGQRYGGGRGGGSSYSSRGSGGGYSGGRGSGSSSRGADDGHPNSQAVQSLLVGLSQMLQAGGTSDRDYQSSRRGASTGYSSSSAGGSRYSSGRDSYGGDYGGGYYDDHRPSSSSNYSRDERDWRSTQSSSGYSSGGYGGGGRGGTGGGRTQQYNKNRRY